MPLHRGPALELPGLHFGVVRLKDVAGERRRPARPHWANADHTGQHGWEPAASPGPTAPAGRLLPSAVGKVARTGEPLVFLSSAIHNVSYQVQAAPVLGPFGDVYAVACTMATDGHPLLEPPPVGAWEWDITTRMGRATRQLFDVTRTPFELRKSQFSTVEYTASLAVPARFSAANLWTRMTKTTNEDLVFETLLGEDEHPYLVCGDRSSRATHPSRSGELRLTSPTFTLRLRKKLTTCW